MIELGAEPRFRLAIYNGTAGASLCRRGPSRLLSLAAMLALALSSGACSYKLDSMFSRDTERSETTRAAMASPVTQRLLWVIPRSRIRPRAVIAVGRLRGTQ